jgi:hypothetical protein
VLLAIEPTRIKLNIEAGSDPDRLCERAACERAAR